MKLSRYTLPGTLDGLIRTLRKFIDDTVYTVNNGIRIDQNLDADIVTVADTGDADTEFTVSHSLKRVPTGYIVSKNSNGGVVYTGETAWTSTAIYLKNTVANGNVNIIVY